MLSNENTCHFSACSQVRIAQPIWVRRLQCNSRQG